MEFVSFIDTRKGKKLLKVFKSQRAANMFLKKNMDNILSKSGVDSIGSMSKKEWDTKEAKYAIEGFKSDAQRKAAFANGYEEKGKKKSESVNEILVIVDKFDKRKQDYDKVYYQDGGKRPGDGDINKAQKEFAKLSKKHKGLTLISVGRNSKMYDVNESVNEAIKGRNNKTGESFGMVIGSDKQGNNGYELKVRKMYNSRISAYGFIFDKDSNLIDIRDYGYSLDGKFPDMKGHASSTSVRPNKRETITQIAKITSPAFAKKIYQHVQKNNKMNESVNEGISVFDERHFGKKGIIIMIDDNGKKVSAIFKDKKNADKFNRNKPSDIKKLLQLAKKTKYPKAIDESVNEGKKRFKRQDGIGKAKYTISFHDGRKKHKDGSDFFDIKIFKNKKDLSNFVGTLVKKGYKLTNESVNEGKYNYKADALTAYFKGKIDAKELDRIARDDFKSGIATKKELSNFLSNKFTQDVMSDTYGIPAGTLIKRVRGLMKFAEGKDDSVPQGYNPMVEDKKEIITLRKKAKSEKAFYDVLDKVEKKYGKRSFELWLDKSLKDLKLNPKKYRTSAEKQEALFQTKL